MSLKLAQQLEKVILAKIEHHSRGRKVFVTISPTKATFNGKTDVSTFRQLLETKLCYLLFQHLVTLWATF